MERIYITQNKKTIAVEISDKEYDKQKNKTKSLMRYIDRIETEKQNKMAARKVCPDCHLKCTESGFCTRCGKDCRNLPKPEPRVKHITDRDANFTPIKITIKR